MKRYLYLAVLAVSGAALALVGTRAIGQTPANPASPGTAQQQHRAMVDTYCVGCHNSRVRIGGLALDELDLSNAPADAEIWEKALRKLRGNLMPPPTSPQPPQETIQAFMSWMENQLDSDAAGPTAGHVPIQRLNRTEYAAAVQDLVSIDVNEAEVLPQDIKVEGFDNVAAALSVSPSFLDQYVTSARKVARAAVGNPNPRISNARYSIAEYQNPEKPLPLGTRGGVRFEHNFPADGEYEISVLDLGVGLYNGTVENETTLVLLIDGVEVFRESIGGPEDLAIANRQGPAGHAQILERFSKIPVTVKAGVRDVVVTFIDRSHVQSDDNVSSGRGGVGMSRLGNGIEIVGPYNPTGISMTESRAKIFVCDPVESSETACARQIAENLATRAFRRPVTEEDMGILMPFYEAGRANGGTFDQGIEQVVAAVLASPDFLYRSIQGTEPGPEESQLTGLELASRLSFFLWSSVPDQELLTLAREARLTDPAALEAQVDRMLADPKASALVSSFAMKWLTLDSLDLVEPDPALFRGFNNALRSDIEKEAEQFIASILLEDRSVVDLLTADHTFLNERLAQHYGIEGIVGNQFRKVTLADPARFGLLGKAAVQMRTSYADRTSPVLRGAWVLEKLKGTPPSPPPPGVETNLDQKSGESPTTLRARLELHRAAATCQQCHGVIDPTGLAMEHFDAIGRWREMDSGQPIDASTVLPNGVAINGLVELREDLTSNQEMFARTVTERLMMYALNRELEYFDMPQIRAVVRQAADENYTLSSLVKGIVQTDAFRMQGPEEMETEPGAEVAAVARRKRLGQ